MSHTATHLGDLTAPALDVSRLRAEFAGEIVTPEYGRRYDELRTVFNGMFDRRPAAIARPTNAHDVASALRYARARSLPVAVRGGGHSVAGYSTVDGGIVIDLGAMREIVVDPGSRRARVQAGATWGELDRATQVHGLATTGGRMTTTGVAGFTLGSGSGWLERLHGLACDNLLSAEVVLADGDVVTASESEHPDLFWGLKGGGGNFGVVTHFEFRLHPVGPVILGGLVLHPRDRAPEVCRSFRDYMQEAPREVGAGLIFMHAPPAPFVPETLRGRPAVAILAGYFGPRESAADVLAPLRLGDPAVDLIRPMPYVELQALTDPGNPPGRRNYWRSQMLPELPDDAIDALIACAATATSPASVMVMGALGGAVADVPDWATPLGGRSSRWLYHCYGIWTDAEEDDRHIAWVRATERAMRPWAGSGVALNFVSEIDNARVRSTFGVEKYQRLVAIKEAYDPHNVFRLNQNIAPEACA